MMKKLVMVSLSLCCALAFANVPTDPTAPQATTMQTPPPAQTKPAPDADPTNVVSNDLTITGAYVQPLIPGQKNTSVYMQINNQTKKSYTITGAYSSIADKTELHTVQMKDGMMKMRTASPITLAPGQQVTFQPGDLHIMLMGVSDLNKDMLVPVCLEFKESDAMCFNVPVMDKRSDNAQDAGEHRQHKVIQIQ